MDVFTRWASRHLTGAWLEKSDSDEKTLTAIRTGETKAFAKIEMAEVESFDLFVRDDTDKNGWRKVVGGGSFSEVALALVKLQKV